MKKHFIIPMALSAMAIAPIVAITNIETKNEVEVQQETQTEFNLDFRDVSANFENALTAALTHYEYWINEALEGQDKRLIDIPGIINPKIKILLDKFEIKEMTIAIPDLTRINLQDKEYSASTISTTDTHYEIGLELDIKLLNLISEENEPINPDGKAMIYLNHNNNSGFSFSLEPQPISKDIGRVSEEEWVYDFSSIGEFLRTEYKFEGENPDLVGAELAAYFSVASLFLVEAKIVGIDNSGLKEPINEIKCIVEAAAAAGEEIDIKVIIPPILKIIDEIEKATPTKEYNIGLEEGIDNKVTVYGQRHGATTTNNLTNNAKIDDKYIVTHKIFTTTDVNNAQPLKPLSNPLSDGAIAGIVIGSLAGAALIGGSTFWFFKKQT